MSDQHTKSLRAFKEADAARERALAELKALESGPRIIDPRDQKEINASIEDLAAGRAVVGHIERPRRKLYAHEIAKDDPKLGEHLEEIASGKLTVVNREELEYETVEATK